MLRVFRRGPVLRTETATGLNGRLFRMYRFDVSGKGALSRTVRKLRMDGLPQFLNVLKGDIAIVGPRAGRPEYRDAVEKYIPFYRERYVVRPGITGWAQTHREQLGVIEDAMVELEYDLYYIKNRSLGLDTLILLHTIKALMLQAEEPETLWAQEEMSASTQ